MASAVDPPPGRGRSRPAEQHSMANREPAAGELAVGVAGPDPGAPAGPQVEDEALRLRGAEYDVWISRPDDPLPKARSSPISSLRRRTTPCGIGVGMVVPVSTSIISCPSASLTKTWSRRLTPIGSPKSRWSLDSSNHRTDDQVGGVLWRGVREALCWRRYSP